MFFLSFKPGKISLALAAALMLLLLVFALSCGGQDENQGSSNIDEQIAMLASGDSSEREAAVEELSQIGEPAIEPLIAVFSGDDQSVDLLNGAKEALVKIGEPAIDPLIASFDYTGSRSATALAWKKDTLAEIGQPAVEPLIAALKDESARVRGGAVEALGKIGDVAAVEQVSALLSDSDEQVRELAAQALGEIASTTAIAPLAGALGDDVYQVRKAAENALIHIKEVNGASPELDAAYNTCVEKTVKPLSDPIGLQINPDGTLVNPESMEGLTDDQKLNILYALNDCIEINH